MLTCLDNVAGTDIDLVKMRNPHGQGEITNGEFDDDGPGWTRYPQVVVIGGSGGGGGIVVVVAVAAAVAVVVDTFTIRLVLLQQLLL